MKNLHSVIMMEIKIFFVFIFLLVAKTKSQMISPCPRLFKYEPKGAKNDIWYGTVTLLSDSELSEVWLRLIFDKPSIQLGNWFGEVVTTDNKEYLIKNRNDKLAANVPYNLRFSIKCNPGETPPKLTMVQLNTKIICSEDGVVTEAQLQTAQLTTSNALLSTPPTPRPPPSTGDNGDTFVRVCVNHLLPKIYRDCKFFQRDFAISNKPKPATETLDAIDATCGTVVMPPRPLITHGQATYKGEFPWHATLYSLAKDIDLKYICGATLINTYHLITAAHCVTQRKSQVAVDPERLVVFLGKYYLKRWFDSGVQDKYVERITVHPQYNAQNFNNDIAILRMSSAVEITNYVRPVCLWDEDIQLQAVISKLGTVVGWGFDENGRITEQLTKAKMTVVSQEICPFPVSSPDFYSRPTSSKTYCASSQNGTSLCHGDSGAGMVFPRTNTNTNTPIWHLRGLVSISVALQNQLKCDSYYVVFTDIAKYLNWIRDSVN